MAKDLKLQTRGQLVSCCLWSPHYYHVDTGATIPRTVRVTLGQVGTDFMDRLDALKALRANITWITDPPPDFPGDIYTQFTGRPHGAPAPPKSAPDSAAEIESLQIINIKLIKELDNLQTQLAALQRHVTETLGRNHSAIASITLDAAAATWKDNYAGRDPRHSANVKADITRFVNDFGPDKLLVELDRCEVDINAWLRKQGVGAARRDALRKNILRFLINSGLQLNRQAVARVTRQEIRRDRGAIRWLSLEQARKLAKHLTGDWLDAFKIQFYLGLRPSELITLKATDLDSQGYLTLSPLQFECRGETRTHTLKTGSRRLAVPRELLPILRKRLKASPLAAFTYKNRPWKSDGRFYRSYLVALKAAASAAGINTPVDCRIARRSFASLQKRAGLSEEEIARIMGDDVKTVREHYGSIQPDEVRTRHKVKL